MLTLVVVILLVFLVLAPATSWAGYYSYRQPWGWLPAVLMLILLVWLLTGGHL